LWSGLGYYSRARNLHRCAQAVVPCTAARFRPQCRAGHAAGHRPLHRGGDRGLLLWRAGRHPRRQRQARPDPRAGLRRRPGQRRRTAAAVGRSRSLAAARDVDVYTQGLMDLGATRVHLAPAGMPSLPAAAPLRGACPGAARALPGEDAQAQAQPARQRLAVAAHGARVWLVQRPPRACGPGCGACPNSDPAALQALTAAWPGQGRWLPAFQHTLTHLDWRLQPCVTGNGRRAGRCDQAPGEGRLVHAMPAAWRWACRRPCAACCGEAGA
jgi:A/G-specific adenine glycosylase